MKIPHVMLGTNNVALRPAPYCDAVFIGAGLTP
jgi:hypothetical protein